VKNSQKIQKKSKIYEEQKNEKKCTKMVGKIEKRHKNWEHIEKDRKWSKNVKIRVKKWTN